MSAPTTTPPAAGTIDEIAARLGVSPDRIRRDPAPGTAVEEDVLATDDGYRPICELLDGVLVEKAVGFYESRLAAVLIQILGGFAEQRGLGIVLGADGTLRLAPGLIRIPDVACFSWDRFPSRKLPREAMPNLAPDLAVEVLSAGNTEVEMSRKLCDYLAAGVRLVWYLDPASRSATVHRADGTTSTVSEDEALEGEAVVPGFSLPLREWFARAGERE